VKRIWAKNYQTVRYFHFSAGGHRCNNPVLGCRAIQPAAVMLGS